MLPPPFFFLLHPETFAGLCLQIRILRLVRLELNSLTVAPANERERVRDCLYFKQIKLLIGAWLKTRHLVKRG